MSLEIFLSWNVSLFAKRFGYPCFKYIGLINALGFGNKCLNMIAVPLLFPPSPDGDSKELLSGAVCKTEKLNEWMNVLSIKGLFWWLKVSQNDKDRSFESLYIQYTHLLSVKWLYCYITVCITWIMWLSAVFKIKYLKVNGLNKDSGGEFWFKLWQQEFHYLTKPTVAVFVVPVVHLVVIAGAEEDAAAGGVPLD